MEGHKKVELRYPVLFFSGRSILGREIMEGA